MTYKLTVFKKVRVPVKGSISDEDGKPVKFDFTLLCDRVDQGQVEAARNDEEKSIKSFLVEVTNDWEGVFDAEGAPLDFNADNLALVFQQPGITQICFAAYMKEIHAVSKP